MGLWVALCSSVHHNGAGWTLDKESGTGCQIGHRNVLENETMQKAFSQTVLLLYFAPLGLLGAAEIPSLAGKRSQCFHCGSVSVDYWRLFAATTS